MLAGVAPLATERVALAHAAGRVLGEAVRAHAPLPPWASSAMDGYAVRSEDVANASVERPVVLEVAGTIAAGQVATRTLAAGQAIRIMTGAPIPDGADCVVPVEHTDGGLEEVAIRRAYDVGASVRPAGQDVAAGAMALPVGVVLDGARLALLAAVGELLPRVHRRPRVALLASGDELAEPGTAAARQPGRVVATNSLALSALLAADGAVVTDLGWVGDSPGALAERAAGAAGCDLLVTTGGVSVGAHDYTRTALEAHGLELDFWRVRVRPGAQIAHGLIPSLGGVRWLGLPGNPVSAQVTYELFVRPLVRTWLGHTRPFRALVPVRLAQQVVRRGPDCHLLRAMLEPDADGWSARLTGPQGSNLLTSMAWADALIVVPPGAGELPAGAAAQAMMLRDPILHVAGVPW